MALGGTLAPPVDAHDEEAARDKLIRRLVVFLQVLGQSLQHEADAARLDAFGQIAEARAQLALVRRDQRLDAKACGHGFNRSGKDDEGESGDKTTWSDRRQQTAKALIPFCEIVSRVKAKKFPTKGHKKTGLGTSESQD